jgi:hypothetical protein
MTIVQDLTGREAATEADAAPAAATSPSTEFAHRAATPQPIQLTATAEELLPMLSRSRPSSSTSANPIISRVIRLSQLRAERGPAVAVLKVARDVRGATELRTQRRVLAEIASSPGLDDEWRELLPMVLALDERLDATVSVESYRPGIDLTEVLAGEPHRVGELTIAALKAITPLHRATARSIVVDNLCAAKQWVVDPAEDLAQICGRRDHRLIPKLGQLESMLTRALVGRRMTVSWTHGDYQPGNVRLAGRQGPINRIVGWGQARGDRPPLIDLYLMLLTASSQVEGADFGAVVSDRLRSGGLSDSERTTLNAACGQSSTEMGIDERLGILLAWLHHTAALCRKDAAQPGRHGWLAANVTPVLEAVAAWRGFDGADGPSSNAAVRP